MLLRAGNWHLKQLNYNQFILTAPTTKITLFLFFDQNRILLSLCLKQTPAFGFAVTECKTVMLC